MPTGYLNDNRDAIWNYSPGFYKDGDNWLAIIHAPPSVSRVRLIGDFLGVQIGSESIELTKTPDGKFWWFKGPDSSFTRAPRHGDKYKFIFNNHWQM